MQVDWNGWGKVDGDRFFSSEPTCSVKAHSSLSFPLPTHIPSTTIGRSKSSGRAHAKRACPLSLGKLWWNIPRHASDQVHVVSDRNPPVGHLKRGLAECDQLVKVWMGQDL